MAPESLHDSEQMRMLNTAIFFPAISQDTQLVGQEAWDAIGVSLPWQRLIPWPFSNQSLTANCLGVCIQRTSQVFISPGFSE